MRNPEFATLILRKCDFTRKYRLLPLTAHMIPQSGRKLQVELEKYASINSAGWCSRTGACASLRDCLRRPTLRFGAFPLRTSHFSTASHGPSELLEGGSPCVVFLLSIISASPRNGLPRRNRSENRSESPPFPLLCCRVESCVVELRFTLNSCPSLPK